MPSANWPREPSFNQNLDGLGRVIVHSLEYTITYQCINRCRGCNHFTYLQPSHMISIAEFKRDVEKMASIAHCDKFSLIGGECLLHPDLLALIDIAKASGIGDVVSLTSNGQLIDRFGDELWNRLDRIEMGVYGGKWDLPKMQALVSRLESRNIPCFLGLVGNHPVEVVSTVKEFCRKDPSRRLTCDNPSFHPTLSQDYATEEEAARRFNRCLYGHICNTLDNGYICRCPEACFIPGLFPNTIEKQDKHLVQDLTAESFLALVKDETHLASCHLCRSLEHYFPWQEVPEGTTPEEWVNLSRG